MAWNTPGSDNGGNERPTRERRGTGAGDLLDRARRFLGSPGGVVRWLPLLLGAWLVASGTVVVPPERRAVVVRMGEFVRLLPPGPHLKLPWPIERAIPIDVAAVRDHSESVPVMTADGNLVNVDLAVQYRIADPELYLFGAQGAEALLKRSAASAVRDAAGRATLDELRAARSPVAGVALSQLARDLREDRTGLVVTSLAVQNVKPPDDLRDAFDDVGRAEQEKARAVAEAQAYAAEVVSKARAQAASIIAGAQGAKQTSIARATGDAQRFSLLVEQYKAAPDITRKRLWLETVQDVLSHNRTIVGGDSRVVIEMPATAAPAAAPAAASASAPATAPLLPPLLPQPSATPARVGTLPAVTATAPGERGPRAPRAPRSGEDR